MTRKAAPGKEYTKLQKAAGELKKVETPEIESVKVSGNKVTVKLTGATENAESYDYVIARKTASQPKNT